jgi:hypothetical protein
MNEQLIIILIVIAVLIIIFVIWQMNNYWYPANKSYQNRIGSYETMSNLWMEHMVYARLALMATMLNNPELNLLAARLSQNATDFKNAVQSTLGSEIANNFYTLFNKHLQSETQFVTAVKNKSQNDKNNALKQLYQNANQMGLYLDHLTQSNGLFVNHMKKHIDTLVANINAYVSNNYKQDIATLDAFLHEGMAMAKSMAQKGI